MAEPKNRVPLRIDTLAAYLEQKLDKEPAVLDVFVTAAAQGDIDPALWQLLFEAARRDARQKELGSAFERLAKDKKLKTLAPAAQADILVQAGTFFTDENPDAVRAVDLFERALAAVPGHALAFERLERLLIERQDMTRLGDLYAAAAAQRAEKNEQLELLRRAIDVVAGVGDDDRVARYNQQILKVDPADNEARKALEERFTRAGKIGDVVKLLEQTLASGAELPEDDELEMRARLITIYAADPKEIERALPHIEQVLRIDPSVEPALEVATLLLDNKTLAARAASVLAGFYERIGDTAEAARMLAVEVDNLRGPKRIEAQKRLASLILQRIGDIHGALPHYENIVTLDPADEEFRQRYRELSAVLEKKADAVKVFTRAVVAAKDPALRARINSELGELLLETGDVKKARAAFQGVLDAGGDDVAVLRAARAMAKIAGEARDTKLLATVLERLVDTETETDARAEAAERLARLQEEDLGDPKAAIATYRKLLDTPREATALAALERLYEAAGDDKELCEVLERRAGAEGDLDAARALAFRAAEIRSTKLQDREAALNAWRVFIATHGPARDAHALMFPLLEQERRWDELAQRLLREADMTPTPERAPVLARIGQIRLGKLQDEKGALGAFRDALAIDPAERAARIPVEKALAGGANARAAADILEPIARTEGSAVLLVRVLATRGATGASAEERLRAYGEAADVAEKQLGDPKRALNLAGRGLLVAVEGAESEGGAGEARAWIERVLRLGASDAAARAEVLREALGDRAITGPVLAELARRAGEALAESGDGAGALAVLRKALAFEPSSPELLAQVDALLQEQGSPTERVALYREALERAGEAAEKNALLHKIGAIERRDLGDAQAAIATYRRALGEVPSDRAAYDALLDAHAAAGPSEAFYADLEQGLGRFEAGTWEPRSTSGAADAEGAVASAPAMAERDATRLRMAEVALACGWPDKAVDHYRALLTADAPLGAPVLDAIDALASGRDDVALLYAVTARRVAVTTEPREQAQWLTRLGEIAATRRKDPAAAAEAWRRAAAIAEQAAAGGEVGEATRAQELYERVLEIAPEDAQAAERLAVIYRAAEAWEKLPAMHEVLLRSAKDADDAARRLLAFEEAAIQARAVDRFVKAAGALAERHGPPAPALADEVQVALARVLASDPARHDQAASVYRRLIEGAEDPRALVGAFESFLAGTQRPADRRWLYTFRLERAPEGERAGVLLAWAEAEETSMGDPQAAAELYARVLAIAPDHEGALTARARLLLDAGDVKGAVGLLTTQRDLREGAARTALDRQLAALFIDRLGRAEDALTAIAPVLAADPGDSQALGIAGRALLDPEARGQAAALLEKACDAAEVPEVKARILDMLLSTSPDAPELRNARRGWFERLLAPLSDNPQKALEVSLRAVAERPQEAALWDRVEQLGREAGTPELVAEAYRSAIARQRGGPIELETVEELGRRAVEFHEQWKDEPTEIAALLEEIVELIPASSWAFERLKLAYNAAEQWGALFALYDRALGRIGDPIERGELLEEAVEAAKNLANDTERTMGYLEQLLPIRKDARTRAALERLYEKHGKYRPLIDLLTAQLTGLDQGAAQRMRGRIAGLWLDGVDDAEAAFEVIEQMLALEPGRPDAIGLLEKLLRATHPASVAGMAAGGRAEALRPPTARQKAAALLEDRYRAEGRAEELARVLEVGLEAAADTGEHARRLREILALRRDKLADATGALDAVSALVQLEPAEVAHREELERLSGELQRFDRLAEALAAAAGPGVDRALSRTLLERAAVVHRDHLQDLGKAIELTRARLGLAEGEAEAELLALRELDSLLAKAGRAGERCDVLERLSAAEPSREARRAALGELARIAWADLRDVGRAVAAYRARLEDDASDREALDGMASALEETERWAELCDVLGRRAGVKAAAGEVEEAKLDRVRAAQILDEKLHDAPAAIEAWNEVRRAFGPDKASGEALAALLERQERWQELVALLESEASSAESAARQGELWRRLGDVHRDRTLQWDRAIESYTRSFRAGDGEAAGGLDALLQKLDLAREDQQPLLVATVGALCEAYAATNDWKRTVALLEARLVAAADGAARVAVLEETARLLEVQGGDASAAFDAVWRAFAILPRAALAAEALRLARAADRWQDVAAALSGPLGEREDVPAPVLRTLLWHVALWHRDARRDPDAAESAVTRALSLVVDGEGSGETEAGAAPQPSEAEILAALAELQRRGRGRPLIGTLLRLAEVAESPLELYREAVETALDPVGDRGLAGETATRLFDAAMKRWPSTGEGGGEGGAEGELPEPGRHALWALDTLVRLAREDGDRARVMELSQKGAELPFGAEARRRLRIQAAEVAEPDVAIAIYRSIFDENPRDPRAGAELEALYRKGGHRADLIALRETQVQVAVGVDPRVELRLDFALLLAEAGELDRAIAALRESLNEAPAHTPSVAKLADLLAARGLHLELLVLWEGQAARLEAAGDTQGAADLWARAAALAEEKLEDVARAVADHRRAADLGAHASLDALARLLTAQGEHAAAAEVLEKLCERASPEVAHVDTLRLVDALVAAGRPEAARERLERAIGVVKTPAPLRERLAVLYREAEAWEPLANLIVEDAARAESRSARAARLREAAELHAVKRRDPLAAIPLLEQASELLPEDMGVRLALCQALVEAGRLMDAAGILRALIAAYGGRRPKERAVVHYELARVLIKAEERTQALEELEAALRIDPSHPDVLHTIARLAFDLDQLDRANRAYRALLLIVRRAREDQSAGVTRAEVLFALSEIAERQNEPERAAEYFDSAFEASRESAEERERLVSALRARGRHGMLARALEARLEGAADVGQAVGILQELAAVYEEHLGRPDDALDARLRAVGLAPGSAPAHEAAFALADRSGQLGKYVALVARLVDEAEGDARKLDLLLHLGRAYKGEPDKDAQAAPIYERAERLFESVEPSAPASSPLQSRFPSRRIEVWRALDGIYGRLGDRAAQAAVLEKLVGAEVPGSPGEQAEPIYRLAALRIAEPDTHAEGARLLERALALDPRPERVESALREAASAAPESEHVLRMLERFGRDSGRPRVLADAVIGLAAIGAASAAQLREAIDVAGTLEDKALAESALRLVLALDPASVPEADRTRALVELGELREAAGDLAEATSLLERAAEGASPEQKRALLLRVADLAAGKLDDLPRAARIYEALREESPASREVWGPLVAIYRRLGDDERLAQLIEATAPLIETAAERSQLRVERALIVMRADPAAAIDLFREVLADDPGQVEASMRLADLLEKAGRTDELTEILTRQLEAAKQRGDAPSVVSLAMKLGGLLEARGDELAELAEPAALDLYRGVLEWDETHQGALHAVVRLGLKREDPTHVGSALEKLLQVEKSEEVVELAKRLAALHAARGDALGAERALEAGYNARPTHPGLKEQLVEQYTARESWKKLADLHAADAERREDKAGRIESLCLAAEILRGRAHDVAGAARVLEGAFELDPADRDVLLALIDACDALGEHERAVNAISVAIEHTPVDPWLYRSRALHQEALGGHDRALADLEKAYAMSGGGYASELVAQIERTLARALEGVSSLGDWDAPAGLHGPERGLKLRLAEVLLRSGDVERARGHLTDVLNANPEDRDALRVLASVEEGAGRWNEAIAVHERLLSLEEGEALVDAALKLADACERGNRLGDAQAGLEKALKAAPGQPALRERLRSIYNAAGLGRELAGLVLEDAAAAADPPARYALLLQAGRLLLASEDAAGAAGVFEQARALRPDRPDDQEAMLLLADAYAAAGKSVEAREVIAQAIAAHKGRRTKQLGIVHQRLARIELAEGNLSEGLASLAKAFETDPSNGALAMQLGLQAVDLCEFDIASRAFRSVTMMKAAPAGSTEGISAASRALAYYHLGDIAKSQGDLRKARLMVEKAVSEDPTLEPARALLDALRAG